MNFIPTRDWVVLPIPVKTKTDSGILLSEQAADSLKSNILKVVAAGPECKSVKEGDTVYVHPETTGVIIEIDKKQFVMVNEFMLLGVIPQV
jgi:co-chaperonin GroES (HSP10)